MFGAGLEGTGGGRRLVPPWLAYAVAGAVTIVSACIPAYDDAANVIRDAQDADLASVDGVDGADGAVDGGADANDGDAVAERDVDADLGGGDTEIAEVDAETETRVETDASTPDVPSEDTPLNEVSADGDAAAQPDDGPGTTICACPDGYFCDEDGACVDHVCGDGRIDGPEACDPPGACPTSCDDGQVCTADSLVGEASACTARCVFTERTTCAGGDGCCPAGCNAASDGDCSPSCGDGLVSPPERCDPPASCPTSCDDGNACTVDRLFGSAAACSANCSNTPIVVCVPGDGCCPAGCHALNDGDCDPVCGNGVVESPERCDPPSSCPTSCNDNDACTVDTIVGAASECTRRCERTAVTTCRHGDGCCPDGCNVLNDGDCDPDCGNGVIEPGETCDPPGSCPTSCNDGNVCTTDRLTGSASSCTRACTSTAITTCTGPDGCCPSGCNNNNDRDCAPACGNGVVESGETCDPPGSCPTSCNDGNACTTDTATGSAASCTRACGHTPISVCVSGDGCCPAGCNANNDGDCAPVCGNAVIEPGETCDPLYTCPVACDDGVACTADTLDGTACTRQCRSTPISACQGGDGCCPGACSAANDYDCAGDCGGCALDCRNDATWPSGWRYFEDRVLQLTNQRRAGGATCGGVYYPPVGAVTFDARLREAARCHTLDMAMTGVVQHEGSDGSTLLERLDDAGFEPQAAAENLAGGVFTPEDVVAAWMLSAGHCSNLMSSYVTRLGVGYVAWDETLYQRYWTQDFGTPAN